jgi:hypothetical protein
MKKKLNFKVIFVIAILLCSIIFTSFLILTNQGPVYDSTHAILYYNEINESQTYDVLVTLQNISYKYYFDLSEPSGDEFYFYHRDESGKIDNKYSIRGEIWEDPFAILLDFKATKSEKEDKELLKSDINFIKNLLYPILGEPIRVSCETMIPSG